MDIQLSPKNNSHIQCNFMGNAPIYGLCHSRMFLAGIYCIYSNMLLIL